MKQVYDKFCRTAPSIPKNSLIGNFLYLYISLSALGSANILFSLQQHIPCLYMKKCQKLLRQNMKLPPNLKCKFTITLLLPHQQRILRKAIEVCSNYKKRKPTHLAMTISSISWSEEFSGNFWPLICSLKANNILHRNFRNMLQKSNNHATNVSINEK